MSSSHTRIITLALAVALLALPATPVLAAPAGHAGAPESQDSGSLGFSAIWTQLTDWFALAFDRTDGPSGQDGTPGSIVDQIGIGSDPDGSPSSDSTTTTSTEGASDPSFDDATG